METYRNRPLALLAFCIILASLSLSMGCRPEEKKVKSDQRELEQKREEKRLVTEGEQRKASELLEQAKATAYQMKLREAFDMLAEVEELDSNLALNVKLFINKFGDELNVECGKLIESDSPERAPKYLGKPTDPLYRASSILSFVISEERFKPTTKKKAEELRDKCNYIKTARDKYYQADRLIGAYKRSEGVAILKELEQKYRDTVWGVAAQDALRYLGEKQNEETE